MYSDELVTPWLEAITDAVPDCRVFDAHTHVGGNDPSGFTAEPQELLASVRLAGAVAAGARALVFPMSEPDGYGGANRRCRQLAAESDGALLPLVRLVPDEEPGRLLADGLEGGARGVKLHPSSDDFDVADPRLADIFARADEEGLLVVVHAGPELSGVGRTALDVCRRHPGLRLVLAHCALTDLGWIWREAQGTTNLFFDTAWWNPAHLMALLRLVPPGRILNASDLPYGTPVSNTIATLRCGYQAGLDASQLRAVAGGQLDLLLEGAAAPDLGPAPGRERRELGPLLEVLVTSLIAAVEATQRGQDPGDALVLARHACDVPDDHPDAATATSVRRLLDVYDERACRLPRRNQFAPGRDVLLVAAVVARTPSAPNP